jgi:hypothetical protein
MLCLLVVAPGVAWAFLWKK